MEISVIGSSQVKVGRANFVNRDLGLCNFQSNPCPSKCYWKTKVGFGRKISWPSKSSARLCLKASSATQSEAVAGDSSRYLRNSKPIGGRKVYVGLPLDTVSDCGTINHSRAISAGLKALKLLGVDGVELPVWWGIAEKDAAGKHEWSGYLALVELVQRVGLELHVSLCLHGSREPLIPLPQWVSQIGESQPSIYFTDRSGKQYKECLSLAIDELPVLDGKTPIEVYKEFLESFKTSFSSFLGSTITGVSVGLGPDGELRYPSQRYRSAKSSRIQGVGEFQCYDKNMLNHLKQHAESTGNPLWGLSGPHDAPSYDQPLNANNFFKEHGGSWEAQYGDFFLSWYSSLLISHGDRLLSLASSMFSDASIPVSGKVPLMQSWYRTRSHPAEMTAGYYNTANKDGYDAVAEMFSRNSCAMILPGMDLSDKHQPNESLSCPELLLAQITATCRKRGVKIYGENSAVSGAPGGFELMKKNLSGGKAAAANSFTYQRMGADFFSPENFPLFAEFVRSLNQGEVHSDDLPVADEVPAGPLPGKKLQTQTA